MPGAVFVRWMATFKSCHGLAEPVLEKNGCCENTCDVLGTILYGGALSRRFAGCSILLVRKARKACDRYGLSVSIRWVGSRGVPRGNKLRAVSRWVEGVDELRDIGRAGSPSSCRTPRSNPSIRICPSRRLSCMDTRLAASGSSRSIPLFTATHRNSCLSIRPVFFGSAVRSRRCSVASFGSPPEAALSEVALSEVGCAREWRIGPAAPSLR
mmetsp:Transcript_12475/g.31595  ORF Transcript_12475/g.31595 Transcript_12475/m.31595 type:complete len:212 (-) Transcript_12475:20-655(-)